jgi:hypothetical protein
VTIGLLKKTSTEIISGVKVQKIKNEIAELIIGRVEANVRPDFA